MERQVVRLTQDNVSLRSASTSFKTETENLLKERECLQNTLRQKDTQIIGIRDAISQHEHSLHDCVSDCEALGRLVRIKYFGVGLPFASMLVVPIGFLMLSLIRFML